MNGALLAGVDRVVVRLRLAQIAAEQADGLLQVVDVVRPDGVLAVGVLEQLLGGNDHRKNSLCQNGLVKHEILLEYGMGC